MDPLDSSLAVHFYRKHQIFGIFLSQFEYYIMYTHNTSHGFRYGFGAYFTVLPGSEWSALMLTYGFPLAIIGMALKVCRFIFFADKLMFPQSILFSLIHFVVCRA